MFPGEIGPRTNLIEPLTNFLQTKGFRKEDQKITVTYFLLEIITSIVAIIV